MKQKLQSSISSSLKIVSLMAIALLLSSCTSGFQAKRLSNVLNSSQLGSVVVPTPTPIGYVPTPTPIPTATPVGYLPTATPVSTTSTPLPSGTPNALSTATNFPEDLSQPYGDPQIDVVNKCTSTTVRGFMNQSSHKLTKFELQNTIMTLLNVSNLNSYSTLSNYFDQFPAEFTSPAAVGDDFEKIHTQEQVMSWIDIADEVSNIMTANNAQMIKGYMSGGCSPTSPSTSCYQDLIKNLGRQLYRRPLAAGDIASYMAMVNSDGTVTLQTIIARMLRSPYFIMHIEGGDGSADSKNRVHLTQYEIANRISYATTGTMSDATLAAAADQGNLQTLTQIKLQVDRLLATSAAKAKIHTFFSDWFRLKQMKPPPDSWANFAMIPDECNKIPGCGSNLYNNHSLDQYYIDELNDFVDDVVWNRKASFKDLMTLPLVYPHEDRMAALFGTSATNPATAQNDPKHPGLLTRVALLSTAAEVPSAIMRGVNLKRRVLCDSIPSPDFTIVANRVIQLEVLDHLTTPNFQIVAQTTSPSTCNSCHAQINPIGFLFEAYNPLGQKKNLQEVLLPVSDFFRYGKSQPITAPGVGVAVLNSFALPGPQSVKIEDGLSSTFNNSDEFISAVSDSTKARACMSVRFFRHIQRRQETESDACALAEMMTLMQGNQPVLSVFSKAIANEDIFWRKPQ